MHPICRIQAYESKINATARGWHKHSSRQTSASFSSHSTHHGGLIRAITSLTISAVSTCEVHHSTSKTDRNLWLRQQYLSVHFLLFTISLIEDRSGEDRGTGGERWKRLEARRGSSCSSSVRHSRRRARRTWQRKSWYMAMDMDMATSGEVMTDCSVEGMGDQELSAYSKIISMCSNVVLALFLSFLQSGFTESQRSGVLA